MTREPEPSTAPSSETGKPAAAEGGGSRVALGILTSRVSGLVRDGAISAYLGSSGFADAWGLAIRGPNVLQNLLGEQALSASFIPVYSRRLAAGREREAGRLAGAIFGLLASVVAVAVLLGIVLAPLVVTVVAPGFLGDAARVAAGEAEVDRFSITVRAVRILFPMTGLLVLSAWSLALLNSHRRFFLPYAAPVLWNLAIVVALVVAGARGGGGELASGERLLIAACVGALVGGALQFLVQLVPVLRLVPDLRVRISRRVAGVSETLSRLGPAIAGRGAVQISLWLEAVLASSLAVGAPITLLRAQRLFGLPVTLFGTAIAIPELPTLAALGDRRESGAVIAERTARSFRRSAVLMAPAVVGSVLLGLWAVSAIYRHGRFGVEDSWAVYLTLLGYVPGMVPAAATRLLQNPYYAAGDTRTPALIASARIALAVLVALPLMLLFDRYRVAEVVPGLTGGDLRLGALGLALGSSVAAWFELAALLRGLRRRLGVFRLPWRALAAPSALAVVAALPSLALGRVLGGAPLPGLVVDLAVLACYGGGYLLLVLAADVGEARSVLARLAGRFRSQR